MSEIIVSLPGSSSTRAQVPTPHASQITFTGAGNVEAEYQQSQAVTSTGAFWTFVSQSLTEYIQAAVSGATFISTPIAALNGTESLDAQDIAEIFGEELQQVHSFNSLYVTETNWGFECLTVLHNSTNEEQFLVYDLELELREKFPQLKFYFEMADPGDQSLEDVRTLELYDGLFTRTA
jgi:hypothetical protein